MKLWILPTAGLAIVAVNGAWDIISGKKSGKSRKKSDRRHQSSRRHQNSRRNKHTLVD